MLNRLKTTTALIAGLSLVAPVPAFPQQAQQGAGGAKMVCADGSAKPCPKGVELVPAKKGEKNKNKAEKKAQGGKSNNTKQNTKKKANAEAAPAENAAPSSESAPAPAPSDESNSATKAAPAGENAPAKAQTEATQPKVVVPDGADATAKPDKGQAKIKKNNEKKPKAASAETDSATTTQEPAPKKAKTGKAGQNKAAAEEAPVLPVQPDAATGKAPVAAAASAAAGGDASANAQVTEEVVTKETARSSDEDFANSVNQPAAAAQKNQKKKKKKNNQTQNQASAQDNDKGLTDTQKVVLLGLGAIAVGAMLSNNRKVQLNSGDRVVVERPDGSYQVIKDDNALLRQPGSTVRTERFDDGSSREIVSRANGSSIITIRDSEYRVLRRVRVAPDGRQTVLFDDTVSFEPVDVSRLPPPAPQVEVTAEDDEAALRAALSQEAGFDRQFSLAQIRDIQPVRALVPEIDLDTITFETGSAAIRPDQARALSRIGELMKSYIDADPREVFLIEGHTDAVGSAPSNLALSDRRAESVALALTEYFDVPPENMVVQGYGEEFLRIPTEDSERENRRAAVRRITDLLRQAAN